MLWTWLAFFREIIFRFLKKMLWGSRAIFLRLFGSHRGKKNKSMKGLVFFFQRLMFLYQLVNLVLETCFIFSKTLKLSKTFCLEFLVLFDRSNNERYDSPIPDFWNKNVQENVNSWVFGVFYKVNCGVHLGFLTHLFQKDVLNVLTCKRTHNFWVSGDM